jgi:hypothetical protein
VKFVFWRKQLVAVLVAFVVWSGFMLVRHTGYPVCVAGRQPKVPACTPQAILRSDWYCRFDPTCITSSYDVKAEQDARAVDTTWRGLAIIGDPGLAPSNKVELLALPNLLRFVGAYLAVGIIACALAVRSKWPSLVMWAVTTWYLLETARWLHSLLVLWPDLVFEYATYLAVFLVLVPVLAVTAGLAVIARRGSSERVQRNAATQPAS